MIRTSCNLERRFQIVNYYIERLPKSLQPIPKLGIAIALVLTLGTVFWFGCFGTKLFEQPDSERFLATFFKGPFLFMIGLFIAWYTAALKHSPSRMAEYKFLNSLPMSAKNICNRFIYQDLLRSSWIPGFMSFLYLGLLPVAPSSHLIRLAILAIFSFFLFIISNTALHFLVVLREKEISKYVYPGRNHPMIMAFLIFGYAVIQLYFIVRPPLASGYQFGIIMGLLVIGNYAILSIARRLFSKWQMKNVAFLSAVDRTAKFSSSWFQISDLFNLFPGLNPWLLKNIVKIKREKSVISVILIAAFIMPAYLISMNNDTIEDSMSVLFGLSCIYSFLVAFRSMNQFSPEEESPELLYVLPLKKSHFYFSVFTPTIVWLAIVMASLAILMLISGSAVALVCWFWLKSLLAAAFFLLAAISYATASYPNLEKSQKQFSYWTATLIVVTAIFYKYRFIALSLMLLVPFFHLQSRRFYFRT